MSFLEHYDWGMRDFFTVFVVTVKGSSRWPSNLYHLGVTNQEIVRVESLSAKHNHVELGGLHKGVEIYKFTVGRDLSLGEIGCAYGHQSAYVSFLKTSSEWALILEDDARMQAPMSNLLDLVVHLSSPSVISLIDRRGGVENPFDRSSKQLIRLWFPSQATSAYFINRSAAEIFIRNYAQNGILSPSDWPYPQSQRISFYVMRKPVFIHDWTGVDSLIALDRNSTINNGAYEPDLLSNFSLVKSLQRIRRLHILGITVKQTWYAEFVLKLLCILSLKLLASENKLKEFCKMKLNRWF
jgi:GR25 family glycosyltransferase involved in LPS biosynthesis